jgi:hypothetical protein
MRPTGAAADQLPCIWVLAGVLSYRLCDRNYDCESCELFHALHGGTHRRAGEAGPADPSDPAGRRGSPVDSESAVNAYVSQLSAGCELHLDRPYSPGYFWLRPLGERVALGLDAHLLRLLYPVEDITLPRAGVCLKRGDTCGWITRGRMAIPLTIPLSGAIECARQDCVARVRASGGLDGADDDLLILQPHESLDAVPGLYRGEDALAWYLRRVQVLKRYLREALATPADPLIGSTLGDGGAPQPDLEKVLGWERFEALVDEISHMQI